MPRGEPEPVILDGFHAPKRLRSGTHRSASLDQTLERVLPVARAIGVSRFADITGLDRVGIPAVLAVRPNGGWLSVDAGKGLTTEAATVSAAMECIERQHAETARPDTFAATWQELDAEGVVAPVDDQLLARRGLFHPEVPERWVWTWDIVNDSPLAVPAAHVGAQPQRRRDGALHNFQPSSNGLSSGNNLVESLCSGICEVIERDALAVWHHRVRTTGARYRQVDPASLPAGPVTGLAEQIAAAELTLCLFDLTVDTCVPTYLAYLIDTAGPAQANFRGLGTHLDPSVAVARAITEAAQARAIVVAGSRDDIFWADRRQAGAADNPRRHAWIRQSPVTAAVDDHCDASCESFQGDLAALLGRLKSAGLERVGVLDMTDPDHGVAVTRVFVPGLEGYHLPEYYTPGRRALAG